MFQRNIMKRRKSFVVLLVSAMVGMGSIVSAETVKPKMFNIKTFGAIGDGVAMETEAVQKTIDACHDAGGGVVWVPAGDFQFGTIILKSNVTLSLDYGASLLGSTNVADYTTEGLSMTAGRRGRIA